MKQLLLLFFLIVTLSSFSLSQADTTEPAEMSTPMVHEAMVQGGFSFPYLPGALKDTLKVGWHAGIGYCISFPPGELGYTSVFLSLDYHNFKAEKDVAAQSFTTMVNFKGTFTLTEIVSPYFSFGVGYMFYSSDSFDVDKKRVGGDDHAIGWNFAIGAEVPINDTFVAYLQGQSVIGILETSRQYFPVSAGVRVRVF